MKYPRTPHLPWSPGYSPDDIRLCKISFSSRVIVTEKEKVLAEINRDRDIKFADCLSRMQTPSTVIGGLFPSGNSSNDLQNNLMILYMLQNMGVIKEVKHPVTK